jgi:hypothetical protein
VTDAPRDETLLTAGFLVALALAAAPAVAVAAPLAVLLDRRGWRRWPAALTGLSLAVGIGGLGGAHAYVEVLRQLVHGAAPRAGAWTLGVSFGAAVGVACAPVLQVVARHRDEHEATRHGRELSRRRRASRQATRRLRRRAWPVPADRTVLGAALDGGVGGSALGSGVVTVPDALWQRQALVVGETGSGKTVTALVIASEMLRAGWDVYWVDGKADRDVAARFAAVARAHGLEAVDGGRRPIDGWRGGPDSVVNRLLATQVFTEPYYEGIARNVLRWAVGLTPPQAFGELVERMDKRVLRRAWRHDPGEAEKIRRLPDAEFLGARYRYEGVAWAVGTSLDGDWSYEDTHAAYVPVGRPEHRNQASEIGAFLLEDLLHWAMARKPPTRRALVVIDEFSKLAARPDAAVDLVERVRSFGVGVVLIGQTWASLGPSDTIRERLAGTVGTVVVHQLKAPERLVALAGTERTVERTEQTDGVAPTGRASQRVARRFVVSPDAVRTLGCGEAVVITGATARRVRVRPPPFEPTEPRPRSWR